MLQYISDTVARESPHFDPRSIAQAFHSLGFHISRNPALRGDKRLLIAARAATRSVVRGDRGWDAQQLAKLAWGLAKIRAPKPSTAALCGAIAERFPATAATATPQSLANAAWGFATARVASPEVFAAVADAATRRDAAEFKTFEISMLLWSFAKAGEAAPAMFEQFVDELCRRDVGGLDPQVVSNATWACATAGHAAPALFAALAPAIVPRLNEFRSQGVVNTLWAFARAGAPAPHLFAAIEADAEHYVRDANHVGAATLAWAFATSGHSGVTAPRLFKAVASEVVRQGPRVYGPQGHANLLWAFAKADVAAPAMFDALAAAVAEPRAARRYPAQGLAIIAWSLATAGISAPATFDAIADEIVSGQHTSPLSRFSAQAIANMMWGFATAGHDAAALFDAVAAHTPSRLRAGELGPQNVANVVWAFAKAGRTEDDELFAAVASHYLTAPEHIPKCAMQELSTVAWAFTTAQQRDCGDSTALFAAIARESTARMNSDEGAAAVSTADLTLLCSAYASADMQAPELFAAIARAVPPKLGDFNSQGLSTVAWAFGRVEPFPHAWRELFNAAAEEALPRIKQGTFPPQAIAGLLFGHSKARVAAPALFDTVASWLPPRVDSCEMQDLCAIAGAYAKLGVAAPELFDAVASRAFLRTDSAEMDHQQVANLAGAFAVSGYIHDKSEEVWGRIATEVSTRFGGMIDVQRGELYYALLTAHLEAPHFDLMSRVGDTAMAELRTAAVRNTIITKSTSQEQVSAALERVGWSHEYEYTTAEGLSLDMAQPSTQIAVEFDGPHHYVMMPDGKLEQSGKTLAKVRLLQATGWKVFSVPWFEWAVFKSDDQELVDEYVLNGVKACERPRLW